MILPSGLLTNTQYAPLRRFVILNNSPEIVVDLKSNVFVNAAVDTLILILGGTGIPTKRFSIGECDAAAKKQVITPPNEQTTESVASQEGCPFNTGAGITYNAIIKKVSNHPKLDCCFNVKAGMKVRKDFVNRTKQSGKSEKFLRGSNVLPHSIDWSGLWVEYDKSLESQFSNQAFRERVF